MTGGFPLEVAGLEDGGVKASPVPSDPEKPGTPGEGMLSSDLDKIPTEGKACVQESSVGKEGPVCGTNCPRPLWWQSPACPPWP